MEVARFHQPNEEPVMLDLIPGQLETDHPYVDVGGSDCCPFVAIEERMGAIIRTCGWPSAGERDEAHLPEEDLVVTEH